MKKENILGSISHGLRALRRRFGHSSAAPTRAGANVLVLRDGKECGGVVKRAFWVDGESRLRVQLADGAIVDVPAASVRRLPRRRAVVAEAPTAVVDAPASATVEAAPAAVEAAPAAMSEAPAAEGGA
jgi:hypothetical protein